MKAQHAKGKVRFEIMNEFVFMNVATLALAVALYPGCQGVVLLT